jgi:hypothetical protein
MSSRNALIGISGVHYVVAELSRRGMVALPTIRNTASYDIVVVTPRGDKHANIQVKASSKRTSFFPMPSVEKIMVGRRDYYVLVRWLEDTKQFEGFMLTGREARRSVQETLAWQRSNIRKGTRRVLFPAIDVSSRSAEWARWRKAWNSWSL